MAQDMETDPVPSLKLKDNPKYQQLIKFISKREYFDIGQKVLRNVESDGILQPSVGQPAVASDQGKFNTCLSHSIAKAVVEFVNDFGLDCSQQKIISFLEETVQKQQKKDGGQGEDFSNAAVFFKVWDKDYPDDKEVVSLGICVQMQTPESFRRFGVKLTEKELQENHIKLVAIWKNDPKAKMQHAVYAKRSYVGQDERMTLDTINSWGKFNDTPQIPFEEVSRMYYITLYKATVFTFNSVGGPSAEIQGGRYGVYMETGFHNGAPYFTQLPTGENQNPQLFYKHVDNQWKVGNGPLDLGPSGLQNKSDSVEPPENGWLYYDGSGSGGKDTKMKPDPEVKLDYNTDSLEEALDVIIKRNEAGGQTDIFGGISLNLFGESQVVSRCSCVTVVTVCAGLYAAASAWTSWV